MSANNAASGAWVLPPVPEGKNEFEAWRLWARNCDELGAWPVLDPSQFEQVDLDQRLVAYRAILANWAKKSVAPDMAQSAALYFWDNALKAPPQVLRSAERLLDESCTWDVRATSPDMLYLTAAFAWRLRDMDPARSKKAWEYLTHSPWQTGPDVLQQLCIRADADNGTREDRTLVKLVGRRLGLGKLLEAKELLEAMVAIQAGKDHIERLDCHEQFKRKPLLNGVEEAVLLLADMYRTGGEVAVHAREVMRYATQLKGEDSAWIATVEKRVWDRPFEECYSATEMLDVRDQLDKELNRVLVAEQPWHARRLAEASLVRHCDRPLIGNAEGNYSSAVLKFCCADRDIITRNPILRRTAEHLALLNMRTRHTTEDAMTLAARLASSEVSVHFVGNGAPLRQCKDDLEWFINDSDPYNLLCKQNLELHDPVAVKRLTDQELRARDQVEGWFNDRSQPSDRKRLDGVLNLIKAPVVWGIKGLSLLPALEQTCVWAFRRIQTSGVLVTGDLEPLRKEGEKLRAEGGYGTALWERALDAANPERWSASGAAGLTSLARAFLPPGLGMAASVADLGFTLAMSYRAVAKVGALYGIDMSSLEGWRFAADAFALGSTSNDAVGLLPYLTRGRKESFQPVTLGAAAYGSTALLGHMWTSPGTSMEEAMDYLVNHLARFCGLALTNDSVAKVIPFFGAIIHGYTIYKFVEVIATAAVAIAARDALLYRVREG